MDDETTQAPDLAAMRTHYDAGHLLEAELAATPYEQFRTWLDDAVAFDVVDTRAAAGVANLRAQVRWRVSR